LKKCFKCGKEKSTNEFYAHKAMSDGHLGKCKECTKKDVIENYNLKRGAYSKYEVERNKSPKGGLKKEYMKKTID
jgi:hypothetical protein